MTCSIFIACYLIEAKGTQTRIIALCICHLNVNNINLFHTLADILMWKKDDISVIRMAKTPRSSLPTF